MSYFVTWKRRREKKYKILYKRGPSTLAAIFAGAALALWAIFAILSSYPVGLYLYYTVLPKTATVLGKVLTDTSVALAQEGGSTIEIPNEVGVTSEVTKDVSLPQGHYLSIPKIGVDTIIWEGEEDNYEKALRKGVWRVNNFGDPEQKEDKAIILAAHRFGYIDWTQEYRLKNSFYKIPDLKPGDQIEIVWNQRRYTYKVTKLEEGKQISDYSSDLILYTCKFLVSPIRIFVYATLVK